MYVKTTIIIFMKTGLRAPCIRYRNRFIWLLIFPSHYIECTRNILICFHAEITSREAAGTTPLLQICRTAIFQSVIFIRLIAGAVQHHQHAAKSFHCPCCCFTYISISHSAKPAAAMITEWCVHFCNDLNSWPVNCI